MENLTRDYLQAVQATGGTPDAELLTPILEALARVRTEVSAG